MISHQKGGFNLNRCAHCHVEIPDGYMMVQVEGGVLCARCNIQSETMRMMNEHYAEGKICYRCGKVARQGHHPAEGWGLTPDPSDLISPRGLMRQLCRECLAAVITEHLGNNQLLIATLHRHGADCAVMIGEGYSTSFKAFVVEHTFTELKNSPFDFINWNNERVLVTVSNGGDCYIAHLVRPLIP